MRIVQIIPGTGGAFYCENCFRDGTTLKALREAGHDVVMVPLYLPLTLDRPEPTANTPVFFGGINVYLQQRLRVFRHTPRFIDRLFDSPWMLRLAAARSASTAAAGLGDLTLSVLRGEDGNQRKEVDRLLAWLRSQKKPDVVHISNILLIGLAAPIRDALNVPVICSLQDEDSWIDALRAPYREQSWGAIRSHAAGVNAFISVSHTYATRMSQRLELPSHHVHVIPLSVDSSAYPAASMDLDPPTIGYLSRMAESLGLGTLVDAYLRLRKQPGLHNLKLRAMGGATGADRAFLASLKSRLADAGAGDDCELITEQDHELRMQFLRSLSVMCVPNVHGGAFGSFMLEAWACGVPVVQPAVGAFAELIGQTGGGITYEDLSVDGLVEALSRVLCDREMAHRLGAAGRDAVVHRFAASQVVSELVATYSRYVHGNPSPPATESPI